MIQLVKEKYGRLDVLVPNHADPGKGGLQLDISEAAYDKVWNVNVKATFFLIKECKPLMTSSGKGGSILVTSSVTGTHPYRMLGIYAMTKAALDNMVKFLAEELRSDKIRVNAIGPGLIKTQFAAPIWKNPNFKNKEALGEPK